MKHFLATNRFIRAALVVPLLILAMVLWSPKFGLFAADAAPAGTTRFGVPAYQIPDPHDCADGKTWTIVPNVGYTGQDGYVGRCMWPIVNDN